jgi:hypothetical protein
VLPSLHIRSASAPAQTKSIKQFFTHSKQLPERRQNTKIRVAKEFGAVLKRCSRLIHIFRSENSL